MVNAIRREASGAAPFDVLDSAAESFFSPHDRHVMIGFDASGSQNDSSLAQREGEARLQAFFELSSDWYWEQDENYRFTLVMGGALEKLSMDLAGGIGKTRWDVGAVPLGDEGRWDRHKAVLDSRKPFDDFVYKHPSPSGTVLYISTSGRPTFDDGGRFTGYRGTARDVSQRVQTSLRLAVEHAITRVLAESNDIAEASPQIIRVICETLEWSCGSRWESGNGGDASIRCCETWGKSAEGIEAFLEVTRAISGADRLAGMHWRVWEECIPVWFRDLGNESAFRRVSAAARAGLRSAFAFPITANSDVVGMMEFFSREIHQPDPELLDCMTYVGSQIGQFIQRKRAEEVSREREERLRAVVDSANEGILVYDRSRRVIAGNAAAERIIGVSMTEIIGASGFTSLLSCVREDGSPLRPEDRPTTITVQSGRPQTGRIIGINRPDGTITWLSVNTGFLRMPGESDYYGVVSTFGDITVQRQAEAALRDSEERFRSLSALSSDMFWEQDAHYRFTSFSGSLSGKLPEDGVQRLLGRTRWDQDYLNMTPDDWAEHRATLDARLPFRDLELCRMDAFGNRMWVSTSGEPVFDAAGEFRGYRGVGKNISERKADEERIKYLANHDPLTALPNRAMFSQVLNLAIETAARYKRKFAVLFIDLDRFKYINDTLGHEAGDKLLQHMSEQLKMAVRSSDVVARLGGDEFVVLVRETGDISRIETVAKKILEVLSGPFVIQGQECGVTASIGISLFPTDAKDEQTLMKNADIAMYRAKEDGKNNYKFYSQEVNTHSFERLALETSLRRGLERNEFFLQYQPKLDLATRQITGVEALVRWQHPELGVVSPNDFIPLAEETGLIVAIGRWVLNSACMQNMAWQRAGLPALRMAVNLSARQFSDERLLPDIDAALKRSGMPPELLELELTESMVVHNTERAGQMLAAIKQRGVRLAIDDFGVGYSSLAHLKRFPIDTLKVDQSFIRDLPHDSEDQAIAKAIIAMGRSLNLTIVAEGVETLEQEIFLQRHGCDETQGYYFSRPIGSDQFAELLRARLGPG